MKTILLGVALATAALGLSGCFTVDRTPLPSGGEHVLMHNYGWYLFDWLPLVCGDARENRPMPMTFFRHDMTADKMQARMAQLAKKRGGKAENLVYTTNDTVLMDLSYMKLPIPYLITYREQQLSGVVK